MHALWTKFIVHTNSRDEAVCRLETDGLSYFTNIAKPMITVKTSIPTMMTRTDKTIEMLA